MTTHRQIQLMLRSPKALLDFKTTGRLPTINVPSGPLITLIESIPRSSWGRITSVVVGPQLGYQGSHRFHNLAQAMNWLKPSQVSASYPSESFRLKRFTTRLTIDDLKQFSQMPEPIEVDWRRRNQCR